MDRRRARSIGRVEDLDAIQRRDLPRVTFEELEALIGDLDSQRKRRIIPVVKGRSVEEISVRSRE